MVKIAAKAAPIIRVAGAGFKFNSQCAIKPGCRFLYWSDCDNLSYFDFHLFLPVLFGCCGGYAKRPNNYGNGAGAKRQHHKKPDNAENFEHYNPLQTLTPIE